MTVEARSPTTTTVLDPGWINPTYAYSSDSQYATCSTDLAKQEYGGYGFNIPSNAVINKVELGIKGYRTYPSTTGIALWIGSGAEQEVLGSFDKLSDFTQWFTSVNISWTPAKVNSIFARIRCDEGGGGCLAEDTLILMFDRTTKKVQDLKENDVLLGMNDTTRQWIRSTVKEVIVRKGNFFMVKIHYRKPNGVIVTSRLSEDHFLWSPSAGQRIKPAELLRGQTLHDYYKDRLVETPIVKMEAFQADTVYDIRLKDGHHYFFGDDLLGMTKDCLMCTAYVDWLPIRATYTIPSGKQIRVTGDGLSEIIA